MSGWRREDVVFTGQALSSADRPELQPPGSSNAHYFCGLSSFPQPAVFLLLKRLSRENCRAALVFVDSNLLLTFVI